MFDYIALITDDRTDVGFRIITDDADSLVKFLSDLRHYTVKDIVKGVINESEKH